MQDLVVVIVVLPVGGDDGRLDHDRGTLIHHGRVGGLALPSSPVAHPLSLILTSLTSVEAAAVTSARLTQVLSTRHLV